MSSVGGTQKLSITQGISIGVGSIIGSGILFLPSLTTKVGGNDALAAWIIITLITLPGLAFFSQMVKAVPNQSGIAGFIGLGLGKHVGNSIPILLLGTVCFGMPSAAIIATRYLQNMLPEMGFITYVLPFILIFTGILTTILGLNSGSKLNTIVSVLLFISGLVIIFICADDVTSYSNVLPVWNMEPLLSASVLAFWAYAGFENLTFLAGDFENPKRDLVFSAGVSIVLCGLLYIALTALYGSLVPANEIDSIAGLVQLGTFSTLPQLTTWLIVAFALFAVIINLVSWSAGVSRAIVSAAEDKMLPIFLKTLDQNGNPKRAAIALGLAFSLSLLLSFFNEGLFEKMLTIVSTNFLILYLLGLMSFVVYSNNLVLRILGAAFSICIIYLLTSSGILILYPALLIGGASLFSYLKNKKGAQS